MFGVIWNMAFKRLAPCPGLGRTSLSASLALLVRNNILCIPPCSVIPDLVSTFSHSFPNCTCRCPWAYTSCSMSSFHQNPPSELFRFSSIRSANWIFGCSSLAPWWLRAACWSRSSSSPARSPQTKLQFKNDTSLNLNYNYSIINYLLRRIKRKQVWHSWNQTLKNKLSITINYLKSWNVAVLRLASSWGIRGP